MNIHEYQAKALLRSYGAPVSDGRVVLRAEEAKTAAGALDGPMWVVKAPRRSKHLFVKNSTPRFMSLIKAKRLQSSPIVV